MDSTERTFTCWEKPFTMMAWFAPIGIVVLLPFTRLPFEKAAFLWLMMNILVLTITALLLWGKENRKIYIPLLAIFSFPMTLLSLYVGQINILVLFGLAIYISLEKTRTSIFARYWVGVNHHQTASGDPDLAFNYPG